MTGNKSLAVKSALGQMVLQGLLLKTVSKGVSLTPQSHTRRSLPLLKIPFNKSLTPFTHTTPNLAQ